MIKLIKLKKKMKLKAIAFSFIGLTSLSIFCSQGEDQIKKKSKIAIISLYNQGYKQVGKYSDWNKYAYAKKHGYDLFLYHELFDLSRPPAWSKIPAIAKHLDDYEWIYWSDADSLIMNNTIKLESLIDNNFDLIITAQASNGVLNTGSFLIRNGNWSRKLLRKIYEQTDFINTTGGWEQSALAYVLSHHKKYYDHIKVLPQRTMNSHIAPGKGQYQPGDFVIHFYGPRGKEPLMEANYNKALNFELQTILGATEKDLSHVLDEINDIEFYFTNHFQYYRDLLIKLIKQYNIKTCCEVGISFGIITEMIAQEKQINLFYSIDPYQATYDNTLQLSQFFFDVLLYKINHRLALLDKKNLLQRQTFGQMSSILKSQKLDFIFCNTMTNHKNFNSNLKRWFDTIKKGGIIAGDNYISESNLNTIIDGFFNAQNIKVHHDPSFARIWWIIKT